MSLAFFALLLCIKVSILYRYNNAYKMVYKNGHAIE